MYEFLPGQLNNHIPNWSSEMVPTFTLTTRVSKIKNISQIADTTAIYKLIKIESEKVLKAVISEAADIPSGFINLEYYDTNVKDRHVVIELDIFPDVWELDMGDLHGNSFFKSNEKANYSNTLEPSQSNIVFCNSKSDWPPYVDGIAIPNERCWITRVNDPTLKRVVYEDSRVEQIHAKGARPDDFSDWRNKPRFSTEKSNYVPQSLYEIYSPDISSFSANKLIEFWKETDLINKSQIGDEPLKKFAGYITKNHTEYFEYQSVIPENVKKYFNSDVDFNQFKEGTVKFFNISAEQDEKLKLAVMRIEADRTSQNKLFDIFHSDKFEIGNFAIGYLSGSYNNPQAPPDERPVLRRFPGHFDSAKNEFLFLGQDTALSKNSVNNWPVFYQRYSTEGLIFVVNDATKEKFGGDKSKQYNTLHTIAHTLIKNIPRYSGIEEGLLKEYIFKEQPAFFIYTREPGIFRTRGLDFILERHMPDIFQDVIETLDCPFQILDTSDIHKEGCGQCTMLPVNCSNFNLNLNRIDAVNLLANL